MEIDDVNEKGNANGTKIQSNTSDDDDSVSSNSIDSSSCDDSLRASKQCDFDDMSVKYFSARSATVPTLRAFTQVRKTTHTTALKIDDAPSKKNMVDI